MKKLLITGFDPFGGESVNPSWEAVKLLPDTIDDIKLVRIQVPTAFVRSGEVLREAVLREKPDVILCVGQAGGRAALTVERVALNLMDAPIPDNDGDSPRDLPVIDGGEDGIFSSLPVKAMGKRICSSSASVTSVSGPQGMEFPICTRLVSISSRIYLVMIPRCPSYSISPCSCMVLR